jgi:hypothetical protein
MASPIWNAFITRYLANRAPVDFVRPPGIIEVEICADSGARPGPGCNNRIVEVFANDQLPADNEQDFLRPLFVDLWTHRIANESCTESVYEATFFNLVVYATEEVVARERQNAQNWLEGTAAGQSWAQQRNISLPLQLPPSGECDEGLRPEVEINEPPDSAAVTGEIEIRGTANGPNFGGYVVEFGLTHNPEGWGQIQSHTLQPVTDGLLARWDVTEREGGPVTIRVIIFGPDNPYTAENDPVTMEARVPIEIVAPTATATPTPTNTTTPTATPTTTETPTTTLTPNPTETTAATPTQTPTPVVIPPTATPTEEPLPATPTDTPTPEP